MHESSGRSGDVLPLSPEKCEEAALILGRAFQNDPFCTYMIPDPVRREAALYWIHVRWAALMMGLGGAFITKGGEGVALWIPAAKAKTLGIRAFIRAGLLAAPWHAGLRNIPRMWRINVDIERRKKEEISSPHWILDVLGVDPAYQKKGFGAALLAHGFSLVDAEGYPAYVVTHNAANIAFYERHGFQLIDKKHSLPGGPPTCTLRRPKKSH